tara:strand:+ start:200 stop:556 length:357 start_codon:yes stop_codon:yes gene_type:complete
MDKRDNKLLTRFVCSKAKGNHGFMLTFANRWTISVRWGENNYSDYKTTVHSLDELESDMHKANTAECAVWDAEGTWQQFGYDTVCGHMDSDAVAKLITEVSSRKVGEVLPEPDDMEED